MGKSAGVGLALRRVRDALEYCGRFGWLLCLFLTVYWLFRLLLGVVGKEGLIEQLPLLWSHLPEVLSLLMPEHVDVELEIVDVAVL